MQTIGMCTASDRACIRRASRASGCGPLGRVLTTVCATSATGSSSAADRPRVVRQRLAETQTSGSYATPSGGRVSDRCPLRDLLRFQRILLTEVLAPVGVR